MKILRLTQPYHSIQPPRFGQDESTTTPARRTLSLGLTVLDNPPAHDHQPGEPGVKPCCAGKKQGGGMGLSLTVLTDSPDPSGASNRGGATLTVLQPNPQHKPGASCCGGHKQTQPPSPLTTTTTHGGSCCSNKKAGHDHAAAPAPTTWPGKIVHAVKSVVRWFGHFFGSFLADVKLLLSGKTQEA